MNKKNCTDYNWPPKKADIKKLADAVDVAVVNMAVALDAARAMFDHAVAQPKIAKSKSLDGLLTSLERVVQRVGEDDVHDLLTSGAMLDAGQKLKEAGYSEDAKLEHYIAWADEKIRLDRTIECVGELCTFLRDAEQIHQKAGRPAYVDWELAIRSLMDTWTIELQRKVTISAHPDDGDNVKPSPAVAFVFGSMSLVDPKITLQACRSVMQNVRSGKSAWLSQEELEQLKSLESPWDPGEHA